ncbi:hypothetical protein [Bacillus sp. NPDC094106]|uniref:hypothetical protein n=1 Tax=Bacillus sp. NPDC094106 TaxID=3363949 RepID=UPI00380058D9
MECNEKKFKNELDNWELFIEKTAKRIGENHGYSVECSTHTIIPKSVIQEIYRRIWKDYAIKDVHIVIFHCGTCEENDKNNPFHMDTNSLLDPNQYNLSHWEPNRLQEMKAHIEEIEEVVKDIVPSSDAEDIKNAFQVYNELFRIKDGRGYCSLVQIDEAFYNKMRSLQIPEIEELLNDAKDLYEVIPNLKHGYMHLTDKPSISK